MSTQANLPLEVLEAAQAEEATSAWKREVNERLAAHRNRKNMEQLQGGQSQPAAQIAGTRAAEAAARVAARYSQAPTYSEMLADEARAAAAAAEAAATAALHAHAAAQAVLAGIEAGIEAAAAAAPKPQPSLASAHIPQAPAIDTPSSRWQDEPIAQQSRWQDTPPAIEEPATSPMAAAVPSQPSVQPTAPQTVPQAALPTNTWATTLQPEPQWEARWERELPQAQPAESVKAHIGSAKAHAAQAAEPQFDFDSTPGYANDPFDTATVEPAQDIQANLIEFPRELIAPRRSRPRLAEGPLVEDSSSEPQMNIFEVDPGAISLEPVTEPSQAEWHGISLGAHPVAPIILNLDEEYTPASSASLLVASFEDRLMSALVDGAFTTLSFLAVAGAAIAVLPHLPPVKTAAPIAGALFVAVAVIYQVLCFLLSDSTPGMRYARIALCTFSDENPTPSQMRKRIPAMLMALLPAGLGLVWAFFDEDHLGWHDRMTHTYQRKY